jgi:short-subunit dehydrogenase
VGSEERRKAIVVGASSGIGAAVATLLPEWGYDVALVARREAELARVADRIRESHPGSRAETYRHDVRAAEEAGKLFERIVEDLHGLDLIVYAAGVMPAVGPDEYDISKDREIVETNLLGAMAWLNAAAPWLAAAGRGVIVGISSIAGERGRRGNPAYCASKAALNSYLESLRNRLARFGVGVVTVKPGFVRTAMLEGRSGTFWVVSPEDAARQILRAAHGRRTEVFVSRRWRIVALAVRSIPSLLFRRLNV